MVGLGEAQPPGDFFFSPQQGDKVALLGRKESFLEGLQPSKPPGAATAQAVPFSSAAR
jgi:hypothetical protein